MQIKIYSPNNDKPYIIEEDDFKFSMSLDTASLRTLNLTVSSKTPIPRFSEVRLSEGKSAIMNAFVLSYSSRDSKTMSLTCKGKEALLKARYSIAYNYGFPDATITKNDLLSSDQPISAGYPGILFLANSTFPVGYYHWDYYSQANAIVRLSGAGLNSRIGSALCYMITWLVRPLVEVANIADLTGNWNMYRNDADLYVRAVGDAPRGNNWMTHGGLTCLNAFDTGVRMGDNEDGDDFFVGSYFLKPDQNMYDVFTGLLNTEGNYIRWRDSANGLIFCDTYS